MKWRWAIFTFIVLIVITTSAEALEVKGNFSESGTISADDFVVYHLNMTEPGKVLDVTVKANKNVDFYLLTPEEYGDYINPTSLRFGYEVREENSQEFHWRGSGNYYLVIDNMNLTEYGAESKGPVNYSITVKLDSKSMMDNVMDNIGYVICGSLIVVAIATTSWLYKKPKLDGVLKK